MVGLDMGACRFPLPYDPYSYPFPFSFYFSLHNKLSFPNPIQRRTRQVPQALKDLPRIFLPITALGFLTHPQNPRIERTPHAAPRPLHRLHIRQRLPHLPPKARLLPMTLPHQLPHTKQQDLVRGYEIHVSELRNVLEQLGDRVQPDDPHRVMRLRVRVHVAVEVQIEEDAQRLRVGALVGEVMEVELVQDLRVGRLSDLLGSLQGLAGAEGGLEE